MAQKRSRWDLPVADVESHMALSYDYIMQMLAQPEAEPRRLDPSGEKPLRLAKGMRRETLLAGGWRDPARLKARAEEAFGLPERRLEFWQAARLKKPWHGGSGSSADSPAP